MNGIAETEQDDDDDLDVNHHVDQHEYRQVKLSPEEQGDEAARTEMIRSNRYWTFPARKSCQSQKADDSTTRRDAAKWFLGIVGAR